MSDLQLFKFKSKYMNLHSIKLGLLLSLFFNIFVYFNFNVNTISVLLLMIIPLVSYLLIRYIETGGYLTPLHGFSIRALIFLPLFLILGLGYISHGSISIIMLFILWLAAESKSFVKGTDNKVNIIKNIYLKGISLGITELVVLTILLVCTLFTNVHPIPLYLTISYCIISVWISILVLKGNGINKPVKKERVKNKNFNKIK